MIWVRSLAVRNARASAAAALLAGGELRLYAGSMPVNGEAVTDQTLLAAWPLADPAGTVADGVFELTLPETVMAAGSGSATWCRFVDSADGWVMDLDAGGAGSGKAVTVSPVEIYAGGQVQVLAFRWTEP
jgi:hypothetical protein